MWLHGRSTITGVRQAIKPRGPVEVLTSGLAGAQVLTELSLAEADVLGGALDAFVFSDELQGLLEAQFPRRDQPDQDVCRFAADVGLLLLLGGVHVHVF